MSDSIVLVGYEDRPNLGLGYLAAMLMREGYDVRVLDFRLGNQQLLERIRQLDPLIIGLSLIFQYYTPDFADLVTYLREHGVLGLICVGGHYPSLRPTEVLELMPGLDCVVRFEGEHTLLQLAERLRNGYEWRDLESIAYLQDGKPVTTSLRPLIEDLDSLPYPYRPSLDEHCLGLRMTSIIASRGCPRACSFCSIRRFYAAPPGRIRRMRAPEAVIDEMRFLYHQHGIRIFLFQDDDFSLMSRRDRAWVNDFVERLCASELHQNVMWKMNCRADEVNLETFAKLKEAGVFFVYLGLESGNPRGLETLNKGITVEQNYHAVEVLKQLGLHYDFGFMLFDPSSSFRSVRENVRFLRNIAGDGSGAIPFCKMLPYAGTDIEEVLTAEGRMRGDIRRPDYAFNDERLEDWFDFLADTLYGWVSGRRALLTLIKWARFELDVAERFFPDTPGIDEHHARLWFITARYNDSICSAVEESAPLFEHPVPGNQQYLAVLRHRAEQQRRWLEERLDYQRSNFLTNSGIALESLAALA